jgi:hypothetical protein
MDKTDAKYFPHPSFSVKYIEMRRQKKQAAKSVAACFFLSSDPEEQSSYKSEYNTVNNTNPDA